MASLDILKDEQIEGRIPLPAGEGSGLPCYLSLDPGEGKDRGLRLAADRPAEFLSAIQRVGSRWVLIPHPTTAGRIRVNGIALACLKILNHGDLLELAGKRLRLNEEVEETLGADAPLIREKKACPVCRKEFAPGEQVFTCPNCQLAHHLECWSYYGKCASSPFCGYVVPAAESPDVEPAAERGRG